MFVHIWDSLGTFYKRSETLHFIFLSLITLKNIDILSLVAGLLKNISSDLSFF